MNPVVADALRFAAVALSSLFFVVDPIATIPAFLASTEGQRDRQRRTTALHATVTCLAVLTVFAAAGTLIFRMFGITMPAFNIAGGVLLFLIALDMLQARRSATQEVAEERLEAEIKEDPGIIPLGVPMLAGPGAISTVLVLVGQARQWWDRVSIFGAILVTSVASYLILSAAVRVRGFLSETGTRVLVRIMGLLLAALAVQFVLNALGDLGLVTRPR